MFVCGSLFRRIWLSGGSASSAIKAGAVHGRVVINDGRVVRIVDGRHVDVRHGAVVRENSAAPASADKSHAALSEPIVNSAVESDVHAPVSRVPGIKSAAPTPVAGRPQSANKW